MGCGATAARHGPSADAKTASVPRPEAITPESPKGPQTHLSVKSVTTEPACPSSPKVFSPVSLERERSLTPVPAQEVTVAELLSRLTGYVPDNHPEATLFRGVLTECTERLAGGLGGVIMGIVDKAFIQDLQFHFLDNGLLMQLCRKVCINIKEEQEHFEAVLRHFCAHNETDRWSQSELEGLAKVLPKDVAPLLAPLESNPKDGAFIFSQSGTVVAAAAHLRYSSERFQLLRADGGSCGTRHAAGLALAEWLGYSGHLGAVFVRSDGGGVHAMLPTGGLDPPLVFHFDSLRHPTQPEMLSLFKQKIMDEGRLMQKVQQGMIRPGMRGEEVTTCVNGRVISNVIIADDTSMVVRANTESKELYVLSRAKFEENWEAEGQEIPDSVFKLHRPKQGILKWVYKVTAADIDLVPTGWFEASWGAMQPLREGDFLALPAPEERATEVYLMDPDCVACYAVPGSEDTPEKGMLPNHQTQQGMMDHFKDRIMRQGRLVTKVEPCMARPGKKGEHVVTCVNARVISDVTIEDDTSMVLRAPTMDQELYVLPQEKFLANWIPEPMDLDESSRVHVLLRQQGFKLYKPRPKTKWVYAVTQEDMQQVPTGYFYSSWGALQPIQAEDYLAMPAPEECAKEVYLMPREVLTCYQEVQDALLQQPALAVE